MINLSDVVSVLKSEWLDTIREEAATAEKQGKLTKRQLLLINDQQWFKILVPAVYGGRQLALPEVLQLEEALAYADGSLGWEVTLCSGAGWFGGFLHPDIAKLVFAGEAVCLAGRGAVHGTAEKTDNGYRVNGYWPYASGSPEATAFTANCALVDDNKPVSDAKGQPVVMSFVFLKNEVRVLNTWNAMGMVATASNAYEVKGLQVMENRAFIINSTPRIDAALYHFPFLQFAEATLAINLSGMALHFMELCNDIFVEKVSSDAVRGADKQGLIEMFNAMMQKLLAARQKLYYSVDMAWQVCAANKEISPSLLYKVSVASSSCVAAVRDCVHSLYPYCGLKAMDKDSDINRVWRDIQTAGHHSLLVWNKSI